MLRTPAWTERLLERDGFVVVPEPVLSEADAKLLRDEFLERWPAERSGFMSDLVVDDTDYRRWASATIAAAVDERVGELFDGWTPFLRNFLCKWPGGSSELYLHRDWMFVDERSGAETFVLWIALQDITGHNGQFRALRSSHRLDQDLRGSALTAPWLRHQEAIERRLVALPVAAGHGIVFNNALVHSSYPNNTDDPRVAVAVGMRRRDTPLTHFRRVDGRTAQRFEVGEEFFLTYTPQGLLAAPPDLPVAEEIAIHETDRTEDELVHGLGTSRVSAVDEARSRMLAPLFAAGASLRRLRHRVRSELVPRATESTRAWTRGRTARARELAASGTRWVGERRNELERGVRDRARPLVDVWDAADRDVPALAAMAVLRVNEAVLDRFAPPGPAIWDPARFEWSASVEAAWPDVRREVEALLGGPIEIPHIEDVTGGIPQGNVGPWRSFVLMHQGRWIPWNCERCPKTTELVESIPGLMMAGFSVLEPGTHITTHRGPNKGALRYQLGVIVPGPHGACRIRVGDEMIRWRDGEGVMFDFTVPHEAWNDSDEIRVLLMLEVLTPLPWYLALPNRVAQRAMTWFPTTRNVDERLKALEPSLVKGAAD